MQHQHRGFIQLLLTVVLSGALFFRSEIDTTFSSLRSNVNSQIRHRQLQNAGEQPLHTNCQIIYVLGIEGVGHHGFSPIMRKLIEHQVDPHTGMQYVFEDPEDPLVQKAIYGRRAGRDAVPNDPELVQELLAKICPDDGAMHVLPLDSSFPSKGYDNYYPVMRQPEWGEMDMYQIANSKTALKHPLNLRAFFRTYSPLVDVKFVTLSSPIMETAARHMGLDGGPEQHLTVLSGYLILIRRFLDEMDRKAPGRWTLVCIEQLSELFHSGDVANVISARHTMIYDLAKFLGWPAERCDECFDSWRGSSRTQTVERRLMARGNTEGKPHLLELMNMKVEVVSNKFWPPTPPLNGQRQCTA